MEVSFNRSQWFSAGRIPFPALSRTVVRSRKSVRPSIIDYSHSDEEAGIANVTERPVFEDPRKHRDRRVAHHPELIPDGECRRKAERRSDRINLGYWWMKRRYGGENNMR